MSEDQDLSVAITRGQPTPEELAAVIAVISEAYAGEVAAAQAIDPPKPSAWMRTRRQMRPALKRGLDFGTWSAR